MQIFCIFSIFRRLFERKPCCTSGMTHFGDGNFISGAVETKTLIHPSFCPETERRKRGEKDISAPPPILLCSRLPYLYLVHPFPNLPKKLANYQSSSLLLHTSTIFSLPRKLSRRKIGGDFKAPGGRVGGGGREYHVLFETHVPVKGFLFL